MSVLAATVLSGNSAAIVADALRSAVEWCDLVLLIDTGITDETASIAQDICGVKLKVISFPWKRDFAAARNFALQAAAENGATWAMTLDTDERMMFPGIASKEELKRGLEGGTDVQINGAPLTPALSRREREKEEKIHAWFVPFKNGSYVKERFIRVPTHLKWQGRTHETILGAKPGERRTLPGCFFDELSKTPEQLRAKVERDLVILLEETRDNPQNPRWWCYLGQSYEDSRLFDQAIDAYVRCFELPGWPEQAAWACYKASHCSIEAGRPQQALEFCTQGLANYAISPELAWHAGFCCYRLERFDEAVAWSQMAIALAEQFRESAAELRIGFRHQPAWCEGPWDVLRFAYRKRGQEDLADEAERKFQVAKEARLNAGG